MSFKITKNVERNSQLSVWHLKYFRYTPILFPAGLRGTKIFILILVAVKSSGEIDWGNFNISVKA